MEATERRGQLADLPSDGVLEAIARLEMRVARLEERMGAAGAPGALPAAAPARPAASTAAGADPEELEFRIGEVYLSQAGVAALLIGMGFLTTYLYTVLPPLGSALAAFLLTGIAFGCSRAVWVRAPRFRMPLVTGSILLLVYAAARLHYFSAEPLIDDPAAGLGALLAAVAASALIAVRLKSQFLGSVALACGYAAGIVADGAHTTLAILVAVTGLAAAFRLRRNWDAAAVFALGVAYAAFLLWLLGNPFMGHRFGMRPDGMAGLPYLFALSALFAAANLFRSRSLANEWSNIILSLRNAGGFYLITLLVTFTYRREGLAAWNLVAALFLMGVALAYWLVRRSFYSASFYALSGFFALSVGIIARFDGAERYALLTWQGLLVILTGIWFRSRIITTGNLLIFLGVYLFYRASGPPSPWVELNYAAASILSARLLGMNKGILDFGTAFLRNVYLSATFCVLPYGLYLAVPGRFVSLSWLGASLFYFAISFILGNKKYRWMGILNFLLVLGRVFLRDLASLDLVFRIISFLALGSVLLGVSIFYGRRSRQPSPLKAEAEEVPREPALARGAPGDAALARRAGSGSGSGAGS